MKTTATQQTGSTSRARQASPPQLPAGDGVEMQSLPTIRDRGQLGVLAVRSERVTSAGESSAGSSRAAGPAPRGAMPRRVSSDTSGTNAAITRALARSGYTNPEEYLADIKDRLSEVGTSFREVIPEHDIEAGTVVRPQPEIEHGPLEPGFPKTIAQWQIAVSQERNRPCDPEAIARILNDVRRTGTADIDESHRTAMKRITPEHVAAWREAIGLTKDDVALMEHNSRTVGRFIPSSSTLFNLINYGVVPWLPSMAPQSDAAHDGHPAKGLKNPMNNAIISIGIAGVLQPLATALMQTPIVAALDTWRKKMGPVVTLDPAVNAKITPQKAAKELKEASQELRAAQGEIDGLFRRMAAAYGIHTGPEPLSEAQVADVVRCLDSDTDGDRQNAFVNELGAAGRKCLDAEGDVRERSDQVRMSTGVQDRQEQSTVHQVLPRVARAASSYVTPIGRWIERAHERAPTPYTTIAAVGAAGVSMVWQHLAAGEDEVEGAANVEEKLNMLYGTHYLKPEGVEALRKGDGGFKAEHLDPAKLRALAPGAASQMLDRVRATIDTYRKGLSAENPAHAPKLAEYEHDLRALEDNDLQNLTAGGEAEKLMHEVIGRGSDKHPVMFAAREGWNKLNKLEITAQIGQRLGVAWMLGAFGNVGSTAIGRTITAAKGGSSHASLPVQFAASTVSTGMGVVSALTNYMPVNVKNERRADPDNVSMGRQVLNSVFSPVWQRSQRKGASASSAEAGKVVADASSSAAAAKLVASGQSDAAEG